MVLSTFLLLWFIVTISTCDNTSLCGLWPTSVWLTDYSSYWLLISVPDRQCNFLLWYIISWGISGYWLKVYSWTGVDDTHLLTWKMFLMLQMKTFDGFLTVLKLPSSGFLHSLFGLESVTNNIQFLELTFCTYLYCFMTWNFTFVSWVLEWYPTSYLSHDSVFFCFQKCDKDTIF
jgi:hypothetical protein